MKFAAFLLAGIGLGLGVAYWQMARNSAPERDLAIAADDPAPIERRLNELETALALERYERRALAEELAALQASIASAEGGIKPVETSSTDDSRTRIAARPEDETPREIRSPGSLERPGAEQRRINRFVDAGFSPERAQWILVREDQLEMEVLQSRYEATQNGASSEEVANISASQFMRDELGDADYEKYLAGLGRPTSINVTDVFTNSPGQAAGLEPGDAIVAYDGKRVFDMNELNGLTYEGDVGEIVSIDVIRDGQPMQLYVARGPIGISGGGRSTRRDR